MNRYECWVKGSDIRREVIAVSRGKAKSKYQRECLYDLGIPYTALACALLGPVREEWVKAAARVSIERLQSGAAV